MKNLAIKYTFRFGNRPAEVFDLQFDPQTLEMINRAERTLPEWSRLEFEQCPHCPLTAEQSPYCPVAVSLIEVVQCFDGIMSYDRVDLEVVTAERRVSQNIEAQKAISSLVGLLISTSGCPHTIYFKPMARFHLPLATGEETVFRATGMFLLAQYFLRKMGKGVDFELEGLNDIYKRMHQLNVSIAERLRHATRTDSSINAVIVLDLFTHTMNLMIEEHLLEIQHLFDPYLEEYYQSILKGARNP